MRVEILALAMVATVSSSIEHAHAQTVFDSRNNWSITLPDGWEVDKGELVTQINDANRGMPAALGDLTVVAVIVPKVRDGRFALVHYRPSIRPGATLSDVERSFVVAAQLDVNRVRRTMDIGVDLQARFDRARRRGILTGVAQSPESGELGLYSVTSFGRSLTVVINCYAPREGFESAKPTLMAIADSFEFTPGFEYEYSTIGRLPPWAGHAITGVLCLGVAIGVVLLKRKLTAASR
ncbi:MAG: hypothetical protein SFZ23_06520 [Planctomycetota bacterium]|nr:hypothetical protein [Planctomycetota bacterium]